MTIKESYNKLKEQMDKRHDYLQKLVDIINKTGKVPAGHETAYNMLKNSGEIIIKDGIIKIVYWENITACKRKIMKAAKKAR